MITKQIVAFVILLTVMVQTYNKAFIVYDYYVNTESFAVNCENKARPELHCNGQCQMVKKLKQEESKDSQNSDHRSSAPEQIISSKSFFSGIPIIHIHKTRIVYNAINDTRVCNMPRAFFHPPCV
ncbi:hypothetical protein QTN47_11915 [Danxiaibacter flavus]|uniref:Secreted protein n=1 Tax=Danxiaibacter flavus TaxID=3049108 RepID=A0ABV3ZED6_9BACT|nr:hypothetical protein QNM32_11920 [Chitinophagaceae bacterium DXS]